jgi:S-adenosylmethionine hydrolase
MPRTIVALTTDFGLSDHFVGVMKGVVLGLCPTAELVDVSHEIAPFSIVEGAFTLAQAYRYFPKKTVHLVVIDPGVGTSRRPIIAEAAGQLFVAPDNGVLSMVFEREKHKVRAVTSDKHFLQPVSDTFHGRDVFAPTAALLAKGVPPARFGKLITDYNRKDFVHATRTGKRTWSGMVLKIDRLGNIVTNFHISEFPVVRTRPFALNAGGREVTALARTFTERPFGELFLIVGGSGYLEVAANQDSAARLAGVVSGAPLELAVY